MSTGTAIAIDRSRSAERIHADVRALSAPPFTATSPGITRHAFTPEYRRTVDYFATALRELDFAVSLDPVGNLVAQNASQDVPAFGLGSHVDSVRNGGAWDGTLGVAVALEVCRLAREHELDLPLRVISFVEEEGAGFGQLLLGSRVATGRVDPGDLRSRFVAVDDGRPFWEHACEAGHDPARWRQAAQTLAGLAGWIEVHIEQARRLEEAGDELGIVEAIAGCIHADIRMTGQADHAGGTPMDMRSDALLMTAELALEVERIALDAGGDTVATVGEVELQPGAINVVAGAVRMSLDVRGSDDAIVGWVAERARVAAGAIAARRGGRAAYEGRQCLRATSMDPQLVAALSAAADAAGARHRRMTSGAVHDTMCVAGRTPSAMLFVPCADGVSHSPDERAEPAHAALAAEVALNTIAALSAHRS